MSRRGAVEVARALRDHHTRRSEQEAHRQPVIGVVASVGSGTPGFTVLIPDTGFVLEADDLVVGHAVAQYDQDYGLKVGDSLTLNPLANGDYTAVAVHTDKEATKRGPATRAASGGGPPSADTGEDGDWAIDPVTGGVFGPKAGGAWPAAPLPIGGGSGIRYTYSNNVALSDPLSGFVKFDNATLASVTGVRISETDRDGNMVAAWIATWDDSTTVAHRGTLIITKDGSPANLLILDVTGALTDNGGWDNFACAVLASNGAFLNGDVLRVVFLRTGDAGLAGTAGAPGATGPAGPSGGAPLAYAEFAVGVGIAATTEALADLVVTAPAFTADGVSSYWVEFFCPQWIAGSAGNNLSAVLFDGATSVGIVGVYGDTSSQAYGPGIVRRKVTPTAGSHIYSIHGFKNAGANAQFSAQAGGTGLQVPGYIRITNDNNAGPVGPTGATGPAGIPGPPGAGGVAIGATFDWAGPARSIPPLYLACFGQSVLRATYPELFGALCPLVNTATVTVASPGVFTTPLAHGLVVGDSVFLTTTGALLTGLTANATYYVMTVPTGTTFTLGSVRTVSAINGGANITSAVNTSGTQSGTHSVWHAPHGVADGTHFNIPDFRGRVGIGQDDMGGTAAGTLTWTRVPGLKAGEQAHLLLTGEGSLPLHTHGIDVRNDGVGTSAGQASVQGNGNPANWGGIGGVNNAAADAAASHNNVPPGVIVQKIIYAGPIDTSTADIHSFLLMGV